jgi:hypothetical protein
MWLKKKLLLDFEEKLAIFTSNETPLQEEVAVQIS